MKASRCFFTGHRILSDSDKEFLPKRIESLVTELTENGIFEYYTGGALGFDYIAANAVLRVREKYPHICLRLYLPCYNHEARWSYNDKYRFHILKSKCDSFEYITKDTYTPGCMHKRNHLMAKTCGTCIAFCKNSKSGTKKTMDFAKIEGCYIINLADEI